MTCLEKAKEKYPAMEEREFISCFCPGDVHIEAEELCGGKLPVGGLTEAPEMCRRCWAQEAKEGEDGG